MVRVIFASRMVSGREATRAEVREVRRHLETSSRVRSFAFVPKRGRQPAGYEVLPRSGEDSQALVAELRSQRGVDEVTAARAC